MPATVCMYTQDYMQDEQCFKPNLRQNEQFYSQTDLMRIGHIKKHDELISSWVAHLLYLAARQST